MGRTRHLVGRASGQTDLGAQMDSRRLNGHINQIDVSRVVIEVCQNTSVVAVVVVAAIVRRRPVVAVLVVAAAVVVRVVVVVVVVPDVDSIAVLVAPLNLRLKVGALSVLVALDGMVGVAAPVAKVPGVGVGHAGVPV